MSSSYALLNPVRPFPLFSRSREADGRGIAWGENVLMVENALFDIHVYQPSESDVLEEFSNGQRGGGGGEDEDVTAAGVHELPNMAFEGLWDTYVASLLSFLPGFGRLLILIRLGLGVVGWSILMISSLDCSIISTRRSFCPMLKLTVRSLVFDSIPRSVR